MRYNWWKRLRLWFAATFRPIGSKPADDAKPLPTVGPKGGTGTPPIQFQPTKTSTRYDQAEGRRLRECGHGCSHDEEAVIVHEGPLLIPDTARADGFAVTSAASGYTFAEVYNPPPPANDGATIADFIAMKEAAPAQPGTQEPTPSYDPPSNSDTSGSDAGGTSCDSGSSSSGGD